MLPKPFLMAKPVLEYIEKHNHKAYFVGGCVRDLLLNRPLGDIDIATSAPPEYIQEIFPKVIPVGIEHGTVIVRYEKESYEVTTFRMDGNYSDKRHPDTVEFIDDINKDLERRDFTINALAMNLHGEVIDLFGGRNDIDKKMIRTVGNGYERFTEDPLRIIRALRFSSQLGFDIHPDTFKQMKDLRKEIESLAVERITNEFTKLFAGEYVANGIRYLKKLGIEKFLPVFSDFPDLINQIPSAIKPLQSFGECIALFNILKPEITVSEWVRKWKCSNKTKLEAIQLLQAYDQYKSNGIDSWLVYQLSSEFYDGFCRLLDILEQTDITIHHMNAIENELEIREKSELAINGYDLIELFPARQKGPWLHQLIKRIEKEVVSGNLNNTKSEIKDWIKWNPLEID
ncbi:CCA tRNA nucleotidyltransferase [Oceanobacillus saliphilus]|uniref:CCA tRNA nucleotidyltransferase n=1 Tax=Oceanobacillus saliphilus TaxID=2925834 RepID=UPI00201DF74B|nr:CCA tRNA nucleotidyltransferase [Oceanobacillus saliphilus]